MATSLPSLKLKHSNFGEAADFEGSFEPGLVLIKGVSGRGKSTLFKAVLFCLYGDLKVKSARPGCVVDVVIAASRIRVRRQKKSERLQVWWGPEHGQVGDSNEPLVTGGTGGTATQTRYAEDAEAQALIDQVLGSKQQYMLTSYIPQGNFNLFFESSAGDRLTLLENVLGREVPIENWLNQLASHKQQVVAYLDSLANQRRSLEQNSLAVVGPEHYRSPEQSDHIKDQISQTYQELAQEQAEAQRESERERHRVQIMTSLNTLVEPKLPVGLLLDTETISQAVTRLNSTRAQLAKDYSLIGQQLQELPKLAKSQALLEQRQTLLNQMAAFENLPPTRLSPTEIAAGRERLKQEANLASLLSSLGLSPIRAELVTLLPQWQQALSDLAIIAKHTAAVAALQQQLSQYPELALESLLQQQISAVIAEQTQTCPECGVVLTLTGQPAKLHKVTGPVLSSAELNRREQQRQQQINLARQRQNLINQLAGLQAQLLPPQPNLPYPPQQIQHIITSLKPFLAILSLPAYSVTAQELDQEAALQQQRLQLQQLTSQLSQVDQQLKSLAVPQLNSAEFSKDKLTAKLAVLKQDLATLDSNLALVNAYQHYQVRRETLLEQLSHIPASDPIRMQRCTDLSENITKLNLELSQATAYHNYSQWAYQLAMLQQQQQEYTLHTDAITILEKEIVTAEYLYVDQLLASLNGLLGEIIGKLFEENITVQLQAFRPLKSGKKLKPVLHLHIIHNGFEKDDIREVSFGMAHRISLAFTLALSKLLGKPFLILDEVGVSLNTTAKEAMLEVLREYGPSLVLITEHGTLEGVFDNVIDLGDIVAVV